MAGDPSLVRLLTMITFAPLPRRRSSRSAEAVEPWHGHVERDDIGPERLGQGHGVDAVVGHPHDVDAGHVGQDIQQHLPVEGGVVGDEDGDASAGQRAHDDGGATIRGGGGGFTTRDVDVIRP